MKIYTRQHVPNTALNRLNKIMGVAALKIDGVAENCAPSLSIS